MAVNVADQILASKLLYFEQNRHVVCQCCGWEFLIHIYTESPSSSNSSWLDLGVAMSMSNVSVQSSIGGDS